MSDPKHDEQHETVWLLLPWLANGTLETAERRLVEDHVAGCAACREEMSRCNGLAAVLRDRQEIAPSPHPLQLARLMERIEASERGADLHSESGDIGDIGDIRDIGDIGEAGEHSGTRGTRELGASLVGGARGIRERGTSLLGDTPRPVRWALAGQLAALILLAAALAFVPARRFQSGKLATATEMPAAPPGALYHTLSEPSARPAPSAAAPQIRVRFAETATEKQMREVLLSTRGRLVDGPSPLGAYTLELPAPARTAAAPDSVGVVLSYLRSQPIVRFAEPVAGTGTPEPSAAPPAAPSGGTAAAGPQGSPEAPPP